MSAQKGAVLYIVGCIPYAKVASYGQVAAFAQMPTGARQVGWILHATGNQKGVNIPWWRVVNNQGRISIKGSRKNTAAQQKELLQAEGLEINNKLEFDIEKYRWRPNIRDLEQLGLDTFYISHIRQKYPQYVNFQ